MTFVANKSLLILLLCVICFNSYVYAQQNNGFREENIDATFLYKSREIGDVSVFFNVLRLVNTTNQSKEFTVDFVLPEAWTIIGSNSSIIRMDIGDTAYIPLRIAIPYNVKGGVANIIAANIIYSNGDKVMAAYCFAKCPERHELFVKPIRRVEYFNPESDLTTFSFKITNSGNTFEQVNFNLQLKDALSMSGEKLGVFVKTIEMNPFSDTLIEFSVAKKMNISYSDRMKAMQRIDVDVFNRQKKTDYTIWFKTLESYYMHKIPQSEKPLVIECAFQHFSQKGTPTFDMILSGKTLLKKNRELFYELSNRYKQNFGNNEMWKKYFMQLGYRNKNWRLVLGDLSSYLGYTKGASVDFSNSSFQAGVTGGRGILNHSTVLTAHIKKNFFDFFNLGGRVLYSKADDSGDENRVVSTGVGFRLLNHSFINAEYLLSEYISPITIGQNIQGDGYRLNYNYGSKKVKVKLSNRYYSPELMLGGNGINEIRGLVSYNINPRTSFALTYNEREYKHKQGNLNDDLYNIQYNRVNRLRLNKIINSKLSFVINSSLETYKTNGYYIEGADDAGFDRFFSTYTPKLEFNLRMKGENRYSSISPHFAVGYTVLSDYYNIYRGVDYSDLLAKNMGVTGFNIGLSKRSRYWGIRTSYYYGPSNLYQQFYYFHQEYLTKSLRINPYFNKFIYKDVLKLEVNASFVNVSERNRSRFFVNNQLNWYLKKGWTLRLMDNYSTLMATEKETGYFSFSNSNYVEFGFKKEFDWHQPRVKYYDLDVVFFIDYNHNNFKDEGEPGLKNVFVEISKDKSDVSGGQVYDAEVELISDQFGAIGYDNVPMGNYQISYSLLEKLSGYYSNTGNDINVTMDRDITMYIPFTERNKVVGNVILNRSRFSRLGNVKISNIKILARDTIGNVYTTLTSGDGSFVLTVPDAGLYHVTITNIFYDNFDLVQQDYYVDFNGYKRFEINFVYNEKARKINFGDNQIIPIKNGHTNGHAKSNLKGQGNQSLVNEQAEDVLMKRNQKEKKETSQTSLPESNIDASVDSEVFPSPIIDKDLRFYIISGSYISPASALKALKALRQLEYNDALIVGKSSDGLTRVSYGTYESRSEAVRKLSHIRKYINSAAWMLEQSQKSTSKAVGLTKTEAEKENVYIRNLEERKQQQKQKDIEEKLKQVERENEEIREMESDNSNLFSEEDINDNIESIIDEVRKDEEKIDTSAVIEKLEKGVGDTVSQENKVEIEDVFEQYEKEEEPLIENIEETQEEIDTMEVLDAGMEDILDDLYIPIDTIIEEKDSLDFILNDTIEPSDTTENLEESLEDILNDLDVSLDTISVDEEENYDDILNKLDDSLNEEESQLGGIDEIHEEADTLEVMDEGLEHILDDLDSSFDTVVEEEENIDDILNDLEGPAETVSEEDEVFVEDVIEQLEIEEEYILEEIEEMPEEIDTIVIIDEGLEDILDDLDSSFDTVIEEEENIDDILNDLEGPADTVSEEDEIFVEDVIEQLEIEEEYVLEEIEEMPEEIDTIVIIDEGLEDILDDLDSSFDTVVEEEENIDDILNDIEGPTDTVSEVNIVQDSIQKEENNNEIEELLGSLNDMANDEDTIETQINLSDEELDLEDILQDIELEMEDEFDIENLSEESVFEQGLVFKVQFEANDDMVDSMKDIEGFPELIRLENEVVYTNLYFRETFVNYNDAIVFMDNIRGMGFSDTSIVAFRDGEIISLEDAGVK